MAARSRRFVAVVAGATIAAGLAACSSGGSSTSSAGSSSASSAGGAGKNLTIAVIPGSTTNGFYIAAHAGADAEAKQLGVTLNWQGGSTFSPDSQTPVVNSLLAQKPSALVIAPTDPTAMVPPLLAWQQANIPIVTFDSTTAGSAVKPVTRVSSDNSGGGLMAADEMIKLTGGTGKVAVIDFETSDTVLEDRLVAFKKELSAKAPNMSIVSTTYTGTDFAKAQAAVSSLYAKYSDLAGVFCTFDDGTINAARGLQQVQASKVKLVGFEADPSEIQLLKSGTISALVAQQPKAEAAQAVEAAYYAASGQTSKIQATSVVKDVLITADNVDSMTQYYYPGNTAS